MRRLQAGTAATFAAIATIGLAVSPWRALGATPPRTPPSRPSGCQRPTTRTSGSDDGGDPAQMTAHHHADQRHEAGRRRGAPARRAGDRHGPIEAKQREQPAVTGVRLARAAPPSHKATTDRHDACSGLRDDRPANCGDSHQAHPALFTRVHTLGSVLRNWANVRLLFQRSQRCSEPSSAGVARRGRAVDRRAVRQRAAESRLSDADRRHRKRGDLNGGRPQPRCGAARSQTPRCGRA